MNGIFTQSIFILQDVFSWRRDSFEHQNQEIEDIEYTKHDLETKNSLEFFEGNIDSKDIAIF